MSIAPRDREALDLALQRSFGGSFVASFDLEMQTRRLTIGFYGPLLGGRTTLLGTLRFFGASALVLENPEGAFPQSVRVNALELSYDDEAEVGAADLRGASGWLMGWSFDGIDYEEHPAVIASLADDE